VCRPSCDSWFVALILSRYLFEAATSSSSAFIIRAYVAKLCGEHEWKRKALNDRSRLHLRADDGSSLRKKVKVMALIQILEILIVVGVLLWLVNRFIPMQGSIKSILNGVVVIAVVLWLLNVFGLFHSLARIHIGT
jgi:hypothetical protein